MRDTTYESVAFRLRTQLHAVAGVRDRTPRRRQRRCAGAALLARRRRDTHVALRADSPPNAPARVTRTSMPRVTTKWRWPRRNAMPALDRQEHVSAWTELGDARELAGLFAASLDAYRRALHAAGDDAVTRADLLFGRARAKERAGEFSAALRDLTIGLRLLNDHTTPQAAQARARLRSFAAMVQFGQDRPRRALARAKVAVAEARSADEPLSLGRALIVLDLARTALEGPGDGAYLEGGARDFRSDRRPAYAGERPGESRLSECARVPLGRSGRMAAIGTRARSAHRRFGRRRLLRR